ncbi:carbamate kinase [Aneurinibacillus terranovensis]|uniref:carbamate kinase n=1 Tax=Aneurinibacillus terranovensis TaxID=278991 RepID=UPI00040CC8A7|nr:carbamate kinase [Aneurinibacillus terranovensis]
MNGKKVVIALGGNALQNGNNASSAEAQQKVCQMTAEQLVTIIKDGYEAVIAHGNGPQVGNIVLQQQAAVSDKTPAMPLDTCDAMSQGMIGYWMQQAIDFALAKAGIDKESASIVTQSVVDENDAAFKNPAKPIGPFYTKEEAEKISQEKGFIMREDAGRGWRRVVPSPRPVDIVERNVIRDLVDKGYITIAVGGGGIPVVRKENGALEGVEAVIDKDLGAEKLAELVDADILLILTAVDSVAIHFNTPRQQQLRETTTGQMKNYMEEGEFAPGSMLPKVEAAVQFAETKPGRIAIITSLEKAAAALRGEAGTRITAN